MREIKSAWQAEELPHCRTEMKASERRLHGYFKLFGSFATLLATFRSPTCFARDQVAGWVSGVSRKGFNEAGLSNSKEEV